MSHWILKRIGQSLLTAWAAITITFFLIRYLPGGPMDFIKARLKRRYNNLPEEEVQEKIEIMTEVYTNIQPNAPVHEQYFDYLAGVLQGNFGQSFFFSASVSEVLARALPWTLFVMLCAILLTFGLGVSLGAVMAYLEGTRADKILTGVSIASNSIPYFVAGLVFIYVLGYQLKLFPVGGRYNPSISPDQTVRFILSAMYYASLPIISIVVTGVGGWAVSMRGNSISELGEDYMYVGRLRGIPPRRLAINYIGQNAILPLYTGLMISIGFVFGGSVILERIFVYPGIGFRLIQAVNSRDYTLMMGAFLLITIAVIIGIFIADITYGLIDPRIQTGDR